MISSIHAEMVTITLNGKEVEVPNGINAVEAAALHGSEVPHYCYHPKLSVAGNCRMCLVEMGTPMRDRATGDPNSGGRWKSQDRLGAQASDWLCDQCFSGYALAHGI